MHLSFTPELYQTTTVPLPSLREGTTHYDLNFKASFDSRGSLEDAKRNGTRVEMWTDLPAVGSEETGGWRALAFQYPGEQQAETSTGTSVFSCVPPAATESHAQDGPALYLNARVPASSLHDGTTFSFTYRLVYSSGEIVWLGAFGRNGVLRFERRDIRAQFTPEVIFSGDSALVKASTGKEVGRLNQVLGWERWIINEQGVSYASTFTTPTSHTIILLPRTPSGIHSIAPLEHLVLAVDTPSSGISISESGVIIYTPDAFSNATSEIHTTGQTKLALNQNVRIYKHDIESGMVLFASTKDEYPVTLSAVPLKWPSSTVTSSSVRIPVHELASALPSSPQEFVLSHKGTANYFPVSRSSSDDDTVTIQASASGTQFSLTPLFSVPSTSGNSEPVGVSLLSSHAKAEVTATVVAASLLPTPPPSPPPVEPTVLSNSTEILDKEGDLQPKEVKDVEVSIVEDIDTTNLPAGSSSPHGSPISTIPSSPVNIPSPSGPLEYSQFRAVIPIQSRSIMQLAIQYVFKTLLPRFFSILWIVLAFFGWRTIERPDEAQLIPETDEDQDLAEAPTEQNTSAKIGADEERFESLSVIEEVPEPEGPTVDLPEFVENNTPENDEAQSEVTVVAASSESKVEEQSVMTVEEQHVATSTRVVPGPAYFTAVNLAQTVTLLLRLPFSEGKPKSPNFSIQLDGKPVADFRMEPLPVSPSDSEVASYLVEFDSPALGGRLELCV